MSCNSVCGFNQWWLVTAIRNPLLSQSERSTWGRGQINLWHHAIFRCKKKTNNEKIHMIQGRINKPSYHLSPEKELQAFSFSHSERNSHYWSANTSVNTNHFIWIFIVPSAKGCTAVVCYIVISWVKSSSYTVSAGHCWRIRWPPELHAMWIISFVLDGLLSRC